MMNGDELRELLNGLQSAPALGNGYASDAEIAAWAERTVQVYVPGRQISVGKME